MNPATLVQRQRSYFQTDETRPLEFRHARLRELHAAIEAHEEAILAALHADLRKPRQEAYSSEIGLVLGEIRRALARLPQWMKPERHGLPLLAWPGRAEVRPEPLGVALILGPWNYPFQLLLGPLVGAIAAGNCACLKPSEFAPETSAVIRRLIAAVFPQHYVAVVEGGRDEAEALLAERFDSIFFTGGTHAGRAVMTAAARHLTPVTLELGGKCPCIVCADTPLEIAARRIAWGKWMNAGQTCVAPDFVLVDRRVRDAFIAALSQAVGAFYGLDPAASPDYGRIVNQRHFERLMRLLESGAVVHGGQNIPSELYMAPTILTGVLPESPAMQEEIFGPILPVLDFADFDEALRRVRALPSPLALYLFSQNPEKQRRAVAETRSGCVCMNDTVVQLLGKDLPFGGVGESGMGAYHGRASFNCFTHRKAVVRRSTWFDSRLRYPPFNQPFDRFKRAYKLLLGA